MGGKVSEDLDVDAVLNRMAAAGGEKTLAGLARVTGLSQQALTQSRYRGSIALPLLMDVAKNTGVSLDHLIYGKEDYVELRTFADSPQAIGFKENWLVGSFGSFAEQSLRLFVDGNEIMLIDVDYTSVDDGMYALTDPKKPVIRECKRQLNGRIKVEGEDQLMSVEDLQKIGIVGRVVWRGQSV